MPFRNVVMIVIIVSSCVLGCKSDQDVCGCDSMPLKCGALNDCDLDVKIFWFDKLDSGMCEKLIAEYEFTNIQSGCMVRRSLYTRGEAVKSYYYSSEIDVILLIKKLLVDYGATCVSPKVYAIYEDLPFQLDLVHGVEEIIFSYTKKVNVGAD